MLVLAQFDVRLGHKIVWTSDDVDVNEIKGIEFEMMPSGLHDVECDVVYFQSGKYEGVAAFCAKTSAIDPRDRSAHRVYALAALDTQVPWNQESFLKYELEKFMEVEDTAVLPQTFGAADPKNHAILATNSFIDWYGPLVFELWKAAISRSRLVLRSHLPIRDMSKFTYIVNRLGMIPADIKHLLPEQHQSETEYRCLFNVTLLDMAKLQATSSFCATTTDDVLLVPSRNAYSVWVDRDSMHFDDGTVTWPTRRDRQKFIQLIDHIGLAYTPRQAGWYNTFEKIADSASSGLIWWAAAGDTSLLAQDDLPEVITSEPEGVAVIGAFHNYTRKIVRVLANLVEESDSLILVDVADIFAMGLDPHSSSDRAFIERFALEWWDRPVRFRGWWCCT